MLRTRVTAMDGNRNLQI